MDGKWDGKQYFSLFGKQRKTGTDGKWDGLFFTRTHNYFPPKSGGKLWERKRSHCAITGLPSPNVYKFINSTPIFINSTPISNPENQQHTHIHQTHIQIHINNQSEIEKEEERKKKMLKKMPKSTFSPPKIFAISAQNHCP